MTVATEVAYAERAWSGTETDFAPGLSALDAGHVQLSYRDQFGVVTALTAGVHVALAKAGAAGQVGAISATPLGMPSAPGTVIFERVTPATQDVDFEGLEDFDPEIHTRLHDAAALRDAELKGRQARAITPWGIVTDELVDFRPRRVQAADPVEDQDLATKIYVLTVTGVLNLTSYVAAAAASAAAAAASLAANLLAQAAGEAARDKAQLWAEQPEDVEVESGKYSAHHWADKAIAAAAIILPYLSETDDGLFGDPDTGSVDDGAFT